MAAPDYTDKGGIPETATGRAEIAAIRHLDINSDVDREKIIDIFAQKLQDCLPVLKRFAGFKTRHGMIFLLMLGIWPLIQTNTGFA